VGLEPLGNPEILAGELEVSAPQPSERASLTQPSKTLRWTLGLGAAVMAAIGLVLLFLLTQATDNREMYEHNYAQLFAINVVVAGTLFLVIAWVVFKLIVRLKQGRFGSRLLVKLAAVFALAGFVPGMLIYVVSYQFVSRSIESWFDIKVEGALEAGLNLGRATLDALSTDLAGKTRAAAAQLNDNPDVTAGLLLERIREQMAVRDVMLWGANGQLISVAGASRFEINPERPSTQQFRSARGQRSVTWIEGLDESGTSTSPSHARIKALALVPRAGLDMLGESRYLMVTQELSDTLVANALAVTQAHREYQERALARDGLRRMYIGTLTLSLFLAVFGAVLLAILLGNQITRPLLLLAQGVREVAAGDLTPKAILQGRDELGGLTRSFAKMTQQLFDARLALEHSMEEVNAARENLQTILDNLTAGVLVLDEQGVIQSANPGATRILKVPMAACEGRKLVDVEGLEEFANNVQRQFEAFLGERSEHGLDHWQQSFELGISHPAGAVAGLHADGLITLVARGAELPGHARLLVFDDISEIVSAQRAQAWGEVARRLAHEIKNPLTPIQLSAERLEMKLTGKVAPTEQALLTKSVKTIVDQVDAMKRLVNEFRDYARLPAAQLRAMDLNNLVTEIAHFYSGDNVPIPVRMELDARCPKIRGDEQQLRQVLHNLVQNAQDATESAGRSGVAYSVLVRTHWSTSSGRVRLSVLDHGAGFPDSILKRAFEPYVTTKAKGTGLGLAVVKKIVDEHGARIDLSNRLLDDVVQGAQVSVSFATERPTTA
jgi:nitrogen fixation/metabolism regulation signal transduction histidine kinase